MPYLIAREVTPHDTGLIAWWDALDDALVDDKEVPRELAVLSCYERAEVSRDRVDEVVGYAITLEGYEPENPPFSIIGSD